MTTFKLTFLGGNGPGDYFVLQIIYRSQCLHYFYWIPDRHRELERAVLLGAIGTRANDFNNLYVSMQQYGRFSHLNYHGPDTAVKNIIGAAELPVYDEFEYWLPRAEAFAVREIISP